MDNNLFIFLLFISKKHLYIVAAYHQTPLFTHSDTHNESHKLAPKSHAEHIKTKYSM